MPQDPHLAQPLQGLDWLKAQLQDRFHQGMQVLGGPDPMIGGAMEVPGGIKGLLSAGPLQRLLGAASQDIRPAEADSIRLFRGQLGNQKYPASTIKSDAGRWFTPDKEQAASFGKTLHYIDIPHTEYKKLTNIEQELARYAPGANPLKGKGILLSPEYANSAKRLE